MIESKLVYYGITEEESKNKYIEYKSNSKYHGKGVNLDLEGLRKFIKDSKLDNEIKYYFVTSIENFEIIEDVYLDSEYNMVLVKIPFKIKIEKVYEIGDYNE